MASDNDLWKQKFLEELADRVTEDETESDDDLVEWKDKFAGLWRQNQKVGIRGRVSCNLQTVV